MQTPNLYTLSPFFRTRQPRFRSRDPPWPSSLSMVHGPVSLSLSLSPSPKRLIFYAQPSLQYPKSTLAAPGTQLGKASEVNATFSRRHSTPIPCSCWRTRRWFGASLRMNFRCHYRLFDAHTVQRRRKKTERHTQKNKKKLSACEPLKRAGGREMVEVVGES